MNQIAVRTSDSKGVQHERARYFPATAEAALRDGDAVHALATPQNITEEWLTRILRLSYPDVAAVASFSCEPVCANDFDVLVRLSLQYHDADAGGPVSLLGKFTRPLPSPRWRDFVFQGFIREATTYQELNQHYACRVPALRFAVADEFGCNLLLEDRGFAVLDTDESPDCHLAEHEAVLQELAQLHGCFVRTSPASAPDWQLRQRDNARFIAHYYRQGVEALRKVYPGWLATGYFCLLEKFADYVADWHRFERHILTLTHGDARIENVLFERGATNCRASLTSWKLAGLRNPMYDVASLLSNDLSYVARNNSEAKLIQRYCRIFEQSGTQYPLREAYQDYRFNLFGPLIFNICAASFLQDSLAENGDLMKRIRRNCMAIIDWDSMALMEKRKNVIT
ncbi:phosphotransferase family protein [Microbulbifer aggregans]|uniref:phosphotransferase family protein n=1 Tax=Microbulbifer aggregans TaxID=1769779 RepID=UPI001CFE3C8F|nr:phosphotransferase [Microbulbifer aggregans]